MKRIRRVCSYEIIKMMNLKDKSILITGVTGPFSKKFTKWCYWDKNI
ncbi:MAG: hypothetical protein ACK5H1_03545 [Tenacibaculum sp.]